MARRALTSSASAPTELHARRRSIGGARHEASERVVLHAGDFETQGWTLNVSRGGVRVVVEEPLELGTVYTLVVGDEQNAELRHGQVVWIQDEADGQICGIEYLGSSATFLREEAPTRPRSGS